MTARSPGGLQEPQSLDLARRPFWQLGHEAQVARRFVAPELAQAVRAQLLLRAMRAGLQHDAGEDLLAVHGVRHADRGAFEHGGMAQQRLVDLAWRNVFAALDDELLQSSGDEVEA